MKTIAITLTGNPGPLAEVRQQLEKQGIIVDVVDDHSQVAHIVLDEKSAEKKGIIKGFLKMICEEFAGGMRGVCGEMRD